MLIVTSIIGALLIGFIADKTRRYSIILKVLSVEVVMALMFFIIVLKPNNFTLICISVGLIGFGTLSLVPIFMEAAVEVTFPVPAGTPAGMYDSFDLGREDLTKVKVL